MKLIRMMAGAVMLMSSAANATDWRIIQITASPKNRAVVYIDLDTMRPDRAWLYWVWAESNARTLNAFNCADQSYSRLVQSATDDSGNPIATDDDPPQRNYIAPGSTMEKVEQYVCSGGKSVKLPDMKFETSELASKGRQLLAMMAAKD